MNSYKILHVMILDKFLAPFIDFVDEHVGREDQHYVFITSEKYDYGLTPKHKVEFLHTDDDIFITLLEYMKIAKKIILHGLWRDKVDTLLYFNQELLKKCYWIMWGGDFYFPETKSKIRHEIIRKMGFLITANKGDYSLVKKYYLSKGKHINSFAYPSNLFIKHKFKKKQTNCINIQIGNSADPTNDHIEILEQLTKYKNENIKIFAPLSYGNKEYAIEVIKRSKELFGDKFVALTEFMPFEKYLEFLEKIDIAVFAHERQQAFGNIITLLGMGKKIYLNKISNINELLKEFNIQVYDLEAFNLSYLDKEIEKSNIRAIKINFSRNVLLSSYKSWLF